MCAASPLLAELEPAGPSRALGRKLRSRSVHAARVRAAHRAPDLRATPAPAGAVGPGAGDLAADRSTRRGERPAWGSGRDLASDGAGAQGERQCWRGLRGTA